MSDFPAAHSMDTTWFAIDADGYVGIFNSSEGGAVPEDLPSWSTIQNPIEFSQDLLDVLLGDRGELFEYNSSVKIEPVLGYLSIWMEPDREYLSIEILKEEIKSHEEYTLFNPVHVTDRNTIEDLILQLSNDRAIDALRSQSKTIIRFADDKILVYVDRCNLDWLKKSIASGVVVAGTESVYLDENLSWFGWYEYDCHEQYPAPYDRIYSIERPILFTDLPPEITERIRAIELKNIRFSDTKEIQPIEHMPCYTWGRSTHWVDTNGIDRDEFPEYPQSDRSNQE
jgi:hypothetical protein